MEKITLYTEEGEKVAFFVEEQTRINGCTYLLVSEAADEGDEVQAYILKDTSDETSPEACYVFVEDERELEAVSTVFQQMLEDTDLQME